VQAEKLEVKVPAKPSKKQREAIEALNTAAPADFDKTYAEQQIKAHERASSCSKVMPNLATIRR
jgi:predicted outer membrane protein